MIRICSRFFNKNKRAGYLFILLVSLFCNISGQTHEPIFDKISSADGLNAGICRRFYQDKSGYLWIATYNGLMKYDGIGFEMFNPEPGNENSIGGPSINTITEDKNENIWVGTDYGLSVYVKNSRKFYRFLHDPNNKFSLNNNHVRTIYYNNITETLWVGTANGLHALELKNLDVTQPQKAVFRRYLNNPGNYSIDNNLIREITADRKGQILVITDGNCLNKFNVKTDNFDRIFLGQQATSTYKVSTLDNYNNLWISTAKGYLIKCNLNNYQIEILEPLKLIGVSACPLRQLITVGNEIWIATEGAGLIILNILTGQVKSIMHDRVNPFSLSSNILLAIYRDNSGIIWISTNGPEINKYIPNKSNFGYLPEKLNTPSIKHIRSILLDKDNDLWIGTDGEGVFRYNKKSNTYSHYTHNSQNSNSISSNKISYLFEDSKGFIWIGTGNSGINKFDKKSRKFSIYKNNPNDPFSLQNDEIKTITEDIYNNIWVGTTLKGLALLNQKTGKFYHYFSDGSNVNSVNSLLTYKNYLIVGSIGAKIIDLSKVDFSYYPPALKFENLNLPNAVFGVTNIFRDSNNNIWFCTRGGGITKWDFQAGKAITYLKEHGLLSNNIGTIIEDKQKKFWITAKDGVTKFDPVTGKFTSYYPSDGFLANEVFSSKCDSEGRLYFGGLNGIAIFYPGNIKVNSHAPNVEITDLKVYNRIIKVNEKINNRVILPKAISELKEITLTYKENYFSLDIRALDFFNPQRNSYAFQMLGLDDKWIPLGNKHEATFLHLPPGNYIFRAKAANSDGIWNEEGVSLKITILPPWWNTMGFKISATIIIILILISLYLYKIKQLAKQRKILEDEVAQQTKDLKLANENLNRQKESILKLSDFGRKITSTLNLENINNIIFDYVGSIMDTTHLGIGIYEPSSNSIYFSSFLESGKPIMSFHSYLTDTTSCAAWSFNNQKTIYSNDYLNEYPKYISSLKIRTSQIPRSLIYVPLTVEKKRIGVITVQSHNVNAYTFQDYAIIQALSSYIAIALDNANVYSDLDKKNQQLKEQADILNETNTKLEEHQQFIEEQTEELRVNNDQLTEQKIRIEEQAEHLASLNATKDRLFSIIAHDLRNPFNTTIGFADLILHNYNRLSPDKIIKYIGFIHTLSVTGSDLLENLLCWSRSQAGSISYNPHKLNLLYLIEDTVNLLMGSAERKSIKIQTNVNKDLEWFVDENMMKTIMRNLLSNAIKFTPENGSILVTAELTDNHVLVSVADTGTGIPESTKELLFKLDYKISTKGTANESGTGLGLLLCKEFVEKHGGKIWVESEVGKGSTFKFTLPHSHNF